MAADAGGLPTQTDRSRCGNAQPKANLAADRPMESRWFGDGWIGLLERITPQDRNRWRKMGAKRFFRRLSPARGEWERRQRG